MTFEPMHLGWPVPTGFKHRKGPRPGLSGRERGLYYAIRSWGGGAYIAITPCGSAVKIGQSSRPQERLREGSDVIRFCRRNLLGRPVIVRVYPDAIETEREALAFMAPDRIQGEWFRCGPRLNALVRALDERYRDDVDALWREAYGEIEP